MIPRIAFRIALSLVVFPLEVSADPTRLAASLIGRPYVWGAEGPRSFDCSGLTQYVYREFGVDLPRRAISQSQFGERVGRQLRRGDLLFFANDVRRSLVTHVGIYEGAGVMIDASQRYGRVRRSRLDDPYLSERFMFARRPTRGNVREARRPQADGPERRPALRVLERLADVFLRRPR